MLNHLLELGTLRIKEPAANLPLHNLFLYLKHRGQIGEETFSTGHVPFLLFSHAAAEHHLSRYYVKKPAQVTPSSQFRDRFAQSGNI